MTILTADALADTHPELPDDFRRSMRTIKLAGGPWACDTCGRESYLVYRCSRCGADLT